MKIFSIYPILQDFMLLFLLISSYSSFVGILDWQCFFQTKMVDLLETRLFTFSEKQTCYQFKCKCLSVVCQKQCVDSKLKETVCLLGSLQEMWSLFKNRFSLSQFLTHYNRNFGRPLPGLCRKRCKLCHRSNCTVTDKIEQVEIVIRGSQKQRIK